MWALANRSGEGGVVEEELRAVMRVRGVEVGLCGLVLREVGVEA